jgi:sortase A
MASTESGEGGGPLYMSADADDGDFPPLGVFRRLVRETGLALIVIGLIVLLFVGYQLLGTNITEQHNQNKLRQAFERALSAPPTTASIPTPTTTAVADKSSGGSDNPVLGSTSAGSADAAIPTGSAIDHLTIPAIGVDKYVVQGTAEAELAMGPGHYPQTVLPGQIGNAAIAGHRTTYGAPFFRLNNLKIGDDIYITDTSGKRFTYQVTSTKVVSPSDVAVLNPTTTAQLTLTTCNPRFGSSSRLIVVAKLLIAKTTPKAPSTTVPTTTPGATTTTIPGATTVPGATTTLPAAATTVTPTTVTPTTSSTTIPGDVALASANLGQGNPSARGPAIGYGIAVVVLWILTRLAIHHTRRWKRTLAYVVGIAICLIPLWFCFENVVRLLPPNI